MRIAFDSQIFTFQVYGGVSRYFTRLASELTKDQQDVRIFAPLYLNKYLTDLTPSTLSGAQLPFKIPGSLPLLRRINFSLSKPKIAAWNPDILHETYYTTHSSAPKNVPRVLTLYDMIHEKMPHHFSSNDRTSFMKMVALNRADHIICISESSRRDLLEIAPVHRSKTSVVHLGFDAPQRSDHGNESSPWAQPYRPYILYVGQREGWKNFRFFLQSFAQSTRLRKELDVVAFGSRRFTQAEIQLVAELGLRRDQVQHYAGDDAKLVEFYRHAAAFVYPSLYEGFGLPPLEAMANSCPVVSSRISSMPEIIGEAAEYFDPTDHEQLSAAMEVAIFSNSRRNELILLGHERLKRYSWSKCAAETLVVYQRLHSTP